MAGPFRLVGALGAELPEALQAAAAPLSLPVDMEIPAAWTKSEDGKAIERSLRFTDFGAAFAFLTRVAMHAEKVDHHPEFTNVWNRVDFRLTSHDVDGLSERDLALAKKIDALAEAHGGAAPQ